jgi:hypothetical protein
MKTKVAMLIIGLFVIAALPTTALCEDEITETEVTADSEIALTADLEADDTGPPFLEEIYAAINAGDTALHTEIVSEEAARLAADTALQTEIVSEGTARASADETLHTEIVSEETARIAEDTALWAAINNWMSSLAAESAARADADASLQSQIDDILAGSPSPPPGVSFGKLVVERRYGSPDFVDFVKEWLEGTGRTADAKLIYKNLANETVREVYFYGLKPTHYYTMQQYDYIAVEHIEFSVEYVQIVNFSLVGLDVVAMSDCFNFEFNGELLQWIVSVKPPEIYFNHVPFPQFYDDIPMNYGSSLSTPILIEDGYHGIWNRVEGGSIDMKYVNGTITEAKREDVTLSGKLYGTGKRDWLVDWINSWTQDFGSASEQNIAISYWDLSGMLFYQVTFEDAIPTSYILPTVNAYSDGRIIEESVSFTYATSSSY